MNSWLTATVLTTAFVLSACGGGGGGSGGGGSSATTITPVNAWPMRAGYEVLTARGSSDTFDISGSCIGTATLTSGPASPATFDGTSGYAVTSTSTTTFSAGCSLTSQTSTGTNYFDANYDVLGSNSAVYETLLAPVTPLPVTAVLNDNEETYASLTLYQDTAKTTVVGYRVLSYKIEPDSARTSIINLITRLYDGSNQLAITQQARYRMYSDGTWTALSIDVQYAGASGGHLVYTVRH